MGRFGFIGRRLLHTIPLLLGITLATFLITKITPGDPAIAIVGPHVPKADLARIREQLGLDQNLFIQYARYLDQLAHGNLGTSYVYKVPVTTIIASAWPITAWIVGMSCVFALLITLPLAALSAMRRERALDHAVRALSSLGLGLPVFWVGIMLIILITLPTGLFPVGAGFGSSPLSHFRAVFLPATAFAIAISPLLIRSLRSGMIGVLESDYVAATRSIGIEGMPLLRRHVLRNSLVPTVSLLAVQVGYLFFGAVLLEETFSLPGLGYTMVSAAIARDYPVVIGITLVLGITVVAVQLVADVLMAIIDPRIQIS